jgi:UDPglucose--hexose-1-phosphate uridylyltransferase
MQGQRAIILHHRNLKMELRKDPLTRSWVLTGDDSPESAPRAAIECRLCPGASEPVQQISSRAAVIGLGGPWSARSLVHPGAVYHIEGAPERRGEGLYDRMPTVGAHEVLVENPRHDRPLWNADDAEIEQFLLLVAQRIQDLKGDARFRYVSVFKNYGAGSGQEFEHPNSELTATTFIPRRVLYELRAGLDYFKHKERCVFCDILAQEVRGGQRVIEIRGDYVALCPYATRVPYETWILPRTHDSTFEHAALSPAAKLRDLGGLIRRSLQRLRTLTESFHLVLHTAPNHLLQSASLGYWKTLDQDYHWHVEILPILAAKAKSYTFKEVYYSPVSPESAARRLREAPVEV